MSGNLAVVVDEIQRFEINLLATCQPNVHFITLHTAFHNTIPALDSKCKQSTFPK